MAVEKVDCFGRRSLRSTPVQGGFRNDRLGGFSDNKRKGRLLRRAKNAPSTPIQGGFRNDKRKGGLLRQVKTALLAMTY